MPPLPDEPLVSDKSGAHYEQREVTVAWVQGLRLPGGEDWLLHARDAYLPFELLRDERTVDGVDLRALSFLNFGGSGTLTLATGVRGRTITSVEEERELSMLAIEGVLVAQKKPLGGYWLPPVFTALGREWRLGDFGYVEERDHDVV